MARQKDKRRRTTKNVTGQPKKRLSLTTVLCLILVVEIIALGLKAFDDRQAETFAKQTETHREALAVSEFIAGKAATVEQTLRIAYQAGWSTRSTSRAHDDIDAVIILADALSASEGTRLRIAGETASLLIAEDKTLGFTSNNDLIVLFTPNRGSSRFALIKAGAWIPTAYGERTFSLKPQVLNGPQASEMGAITACSPISDAAVSACVQTVRPVFGTKDAVGLLIYALLLLGPALAILGLVRLLDERRGESEAFEGEASRAGRVLKTVLHETKAGFWSWDLNKKSIWISAEAGRLLGGMPEGDYAFGELDKYIYPDHLDTVRQAMNTLPERGFISQVFATADKTKWIDMRARPDEVEGALNGVLLDVTDIRAAIARTKQAENRLKSALEGFSGPFALWDRRKRLVYWNLAFMRIFGLENTARVGMGYDTVMLAQAANILERRATQTEDGAEIIRTRNGIWYKIVERATSTGGMITMGLDVSADVKYEVELQQQQSKLRKFVVDLERPEGHAAELARKLNEEKLRAERSANSKSAFLANMSHELRTPLNAINGFSEILSEEMYGPLGDERYKGYAQDILASGQHLLDMINDILDMAKIEAGKMTVELQPIDLVDPVDAAVRMIRRKAEDKGIKMSLIANEGLPRVDADHRAIRQMILNLVSNAIKFTDEGGEIRVSIDQKGDQLRVAVKDNGIGIPEEALPRLAAPFEQVTETRDRNYEGTGLGLALTKSFAEMHGGKLVIASQEGKGTQVSFFLPISKTNRSQATAAA